MPSNRKKCNNDLNSLGTDDASTLSCWCCAMSYVGSNPKIIIIIILKKLNKKHRKERETERRISRMRRIRRRKKDGKEEKNEKMSGGSFCIGCGWIAFGRCCRLSLQHTIASYGRQGEKQQDNKTRKQENSLQMINIHSFQ